MIIAIWQPQQVLTVTWNPALSAFHAEEWSGLGARIRQRDNQPPDMEGYYFTIESLCEVYTHISEEAIQNCLVEKEKS